MIGLKIGLVVHRFSIGQFLGATCQSSSGTLRLGMKGERTGAMDDIQDLSGNSIGLLQNHWSREYGVLQIHDERARRVAMIDRCNEGSWNGIDQKFSVQLPLLSTTRPPHTS